MADETKKNPDELGALWMKTGSKGDFMTGTINGVNVVCFRNDRKTGNQPDWRVLKSKPREEKDLRHGIEPVTAGDVPF